MAACGFYITPTVPHDVVWLDRIPPSANGSSSGRNLRFPVLVQVLRVCVMVPISPAIKELLTGLLGAITSVDVPGIVKPFQNAVVPALLLKDDRSAAMLWVK